MMGYISPAELFLWVFRNGATADYNVRFQDRRRHRSPLIGPGHRNSGSLQLLLKESADQRCHRSNVQNELMRLVVGEDEGPPAQLHLFECDPDNISSSSSENGTEFANRRSSSNERRIGIAISSMNSTHPPWRAECPILWIFRMDCTSPWHLDGHIADDDDFHRPFGGNVNDRLFMEFGSSLVVAGVLPIPHRFCTSLVEVMLFAGRKTWRPHQRAYLGRKGPENLVVTPGAGGLLREAAQMDEILTRHMDGIEEPLTMPSFVPSYHLWFKFISKTYRQARIGLQSLQNPDDNPNLDCPLHVSIWQILWFILNVRSVDAWGCRSHWAAVSNVGKRKFSEQRKKLVSFFGLGPSRAKKFCQRLTKDFSNLNWPQNCGFSCLD
ncbi:hypothetical protein B0H17DRAFT_1137589 [Mycena rosella]|uniref:Uncharacterized protein n=1 Tax=Mycena rosella TaxID=1033263 RepID=A0AAD7D9M2_MYCRO|nr:hypothetical protein B0H17DRAFT_1137589 [Mycena rosella]